MNLILIVIKKLLGSQEIQKVKNCLSAKNWLSQEKNCQKVKIHLILGL